MRSTPSASAMVDSFLMLFRRSWGGKWVGGSRGAADQPAGAQADPGGRKSPPGTGWGGKTDPRGHETRTWGAAESEPPPPQAAANQQRRFMAAQQHCGRRSPPIGRPAAPRRGCPPLSDWSLPGAQRRSSPPQGGAEEKRGAFSPHCGEAADQSTPRLQNEWALRANPRSPLIPTAVGTKRAPRHEAPPPTGTLRAAVTFRRAERRIGAAGRTGAGRAGLEPPLGTCTSSLRSSSMSTAMG